MKTKSPAEAFIARVATALQQGTFARLLLSAPATEAPAERIIGRLVLIQEQPMLSLTLREARRDTTKNLVLAEVPSWLERVLPQEFRSAVLESAEGALQFAVNSKGKAKLVNHRVQSITPPSLAHDRPKSTLLDDTARPWLVALGLLDDSGRVRPSAADKHRQLTRYLEILSHLVRDCGWTTDERITIADMGCGKGYLTFGAWHLMRNVLQLEVDVIGVETRGELVEQANGVARDIGAAGLRFVAGDIATVELPKLDGLIALHACNTATDEALVRGVRNGARLIVVSPCCHQELRPKLGKPELFKPLFKHGILEERFSEWLTDGLRALRLEQAGYRTKVIEFVASEHTPRNLLVTAVRHEQPTGSAKTCERIRALKEFFALGEIASDAIADGN